MTTIAPAVALYTIDDLRDAIEADFADREIGAVVEVTEFDPETAPGEARVLLEHGRFSVMEPSGHYQPGAIWPVRDSTDVARAMLDDVQRYIVTVHAPGAQGVEGAARAARRATSELKRHTLAAIRRALASPLRGNVDGEWPDLSDRYPGWTRGSVARFEVPIATPILDDPLATGTGDVRVATSEIVLPGDVVTPAETTTDEAT